MLERVSGAIGLPSTLRELEILLEHTFGDRMPRSLALAPRDIDGFSIFLDWDGKSATLILGGGLIHDCSSLDEEFLWAKRAATQHYRLMVERLGRKAFRWTLHEVPASRQPIVVLMSDHPVWFPALRQRHLSYYCNRLA